MSPNSPDIIYKITTAELWARAQAERHLPGMPIDESDGYMHFSTAAQLRETLRLHFLGKSGLVLLAVRTNDVKEHLRWEVSRRDDFFPHLYGALPLNAIIESWPISVDDRGEADLPDVA
jgi:uncharacterized protein (DUF952 family)